MNDHPVPLQQKGRQSDTFEKIEAADSETAARVFQEARRRLLDVSNWGSISNGLSASFTLTDDEGHEKQEPPVKGDHFRIDIPGPGPAAGNGYDWVRVELIEEHPGRSIMIRVRPSVDPGKKEGTAHFFNQEATSSFIVRREGNTVYAQVHGRNELPNTEGENIADRIRNILTGLSAGAGLSKIQWRKLVKGILEGAEELY